MKHLKAAPGQVNWVKRLRRCAPSQCNRFRRGTPQRMTSPVQRMIGFAVCASFGFLISFGSFFRFAKAMAGQPAPFAVNYSLGNIIALCSTGFLVGPCRQLQNITTGHRLLCSVGYLSSIALTLFASFNKGLGHGQAVLILALCVVQFICWAFYVMSYIPFGRTLLKQCITKVLARIIPSE